MHIGQEIICVKDHSEKVVVKGQSFIVKGVKKNDCKCVDTLVDIGLLISEQSDFLQCEECGMLSHFDPIWWLSAELFVPINYSTAKQVTFKEIEEQVPMYCS